MWEHMQRCSGPDGLFKFLQVVWDSGKEFVGNTPTAPFAKLALFIGTLDVTNGIMVSFFKFPNASNGRMLTCCLLLNNAYLKQAFPLKTATYLAT